MAPLKPKPNTFAGQRQRLYRMAAPANCPDRRSLNVGYRQLHSNPQFVGYLEPIPETHSDDVFTRGYVMRQRTWDQPEARIINRSGSFSELSFCKNNNRFPKFKKCSKISKFLGRPYISKYLRDSIPISINSLKLMFYNLLESSGFFRKHSSSNVPSSSAIESETGTMFQTIEPLTQESPRQESGMQESPTQELEMRQQTLLQLEGIQPLSREITILLPSRLRASRLLNLIRPPLTIQEELSLYLSDIEEGSLSVYPHLNPIDMGYGFWGRIKFLLERLVNWRVKLSWSMMIFTGIYVIMNPIPE